MSAGPTPGAAPDGRVEPQAAHVPGDPRGFAPVGAAEHRPGPLEHLFDGTTVVEHRFRVPIDHALTLDEARRQDAAGTGVGPHGAGTMQVLAREVRAADDPDGERPWLLYLQGGPGSGAPRPARLGGWQAELAKDFRLLLLDQRGTGGSSPATAQTLCGPGAFPDDAARAAYLTHLRAPSIVQDAEMVRAALDAGPWTTLGQSFGGFCTLSYLSWRPEGLARCLVTGGLAPLTGHADRVYAATTERMAERAAEFFAMHPEDRGRWAEVVELIRTAEQAGDPVRLADGSALTVGRAQQLGMLLGGSTRVDQLHWALADAVDRSGPVPRVSEAFRAAVAAQASRWTNPLYAVLHEAIYAQPAALADGRGATRWAASRVLAGRPEFSPGAEPAPLFTGEHVLPWSFVTEPELRPLAAVAGLLAAKDDWGPLYDVDRLAVNDVPVSAAVYTHDVYVDRDLSLETASRVRGLHVWETDAFHHDGLADDGAAIVRRLLAMVGDEGEGGVTETAP